jgi:hypothetical protein
MFWVWIKTSILVAGVALFSAPVFATTMGRPGAVNYIEGEVFLNGQPLTSASIGSAELQTGQEIATTNGKAELLLTPGIFLRIGNHSELRMISPDLTNTSVQLLHGEAMVEADQVLKGNNIRIMEDGSTTTLLKPGLYDFNADQAQVAVINGKAQVTEGDKSIDLKKGKETTVSGPLKARSFDRKAEDDLYAWSNLRSSYLAEANVAAARTLVVNNYGWYGPGWYWDPYWDMYSWVPGFGMFYSPFGYGFYSPFTVWAAPVVVGRIGAPRLVAPGRAIGPANRYVGSGFRGAPSFRAAAPAGGFAARGFSGGFTGRVGGGGFAGHVGGGFGRR